MKKVILMLVMLFTVGIYSYGEDTNSNEVNNVESYNVNVNMKSLGSYLELSSDQMEGMESVEVELHNDLMFAAVESTSENRNLVTKNAIDKHIKHVHYILNDEQYNKYLRVLNATLTNRGILK